MVFNYFTFILLSTIYYLTTCIPTDTPRIISTDIEPGGGAYRIILFFNKTRSRVATIVTLNLNKNISCFGNGMNQYSTQCDKLSHFQIFNPIEESTPGQQCNASPSLKDGRLTHQVMNFTYVTLDSTVPPQCTLFIGLNKQFSNEDFSLVHLLYNQGTVQHKRFGFMPSRFKMFFGGFPGEHIVSGRLPSFFYAYHLAIPVQATHGKEFSVLFRKSQGHFIALDFTLKAHFIIKLATNKISLSHKSSSSCIFLSHFLYILYQNFLEKSNYKKQRL